MTEIDSSTEKSEQLTPKMESLIALLLAGVNINAAAAQTGIAEKTAYRWLKLPHFLAAYKAAQKSLFDDKLNELRSGVHTAIETLNRNMTSEDAPASTQVRAAQIWLEQSVSLYKMSELEQKYEELAQLLKSAGIVRL